MNAIEMAIQAALAKAMNSLSERLPELLNNLPPDIVANIGQISQTVLSFKAQLDRIENQNRLIIAHLKIPAETEITEIDDNGQRKLSGNAPH